MTWKQVFYGPDLIENYVLIVYAVFYCSKTVIDEWEFADGLLTIR
jgi:hypothetical protein